MERTFLETVQFLGLDLELALVAAMVALEGVRRLVVYLKSRHRTRPSRARRLPPGSMVWPPAGWQANR